MNNEVLRQVVFICRQMYLGKPLMTKLYLSYYFQCNIKRGRNSTGPLLDIYWIYVLYCIVLTRTLGIDSKLTPDKQVFPLLKANFAYLESFQTPDVCFFCKLMICARSPYILNFTKKILHQSTCMLEIQNHFCKYFNSLFHTNFSKSLQSFSTCAVCVLQPWTMSILSSILVTDTTGSSCLTTEFI